MDRNALVSKPVVSTLPSWRAAYLMRRWTPSPMAVTMSANSSSFSRSPPPPPDTLLAMSVGDALAMVRSAASHSTGQPWRPPTKPNMTEKHQRLRKSLCLRRGQGHVRGKRQDGSRSQHAGA